MNQKRKFRLPYMHNTSFVKAGMKKAAFVNLLIVSFLGVALRYKIAFPLPFVDQKFLLHAHSHFAFTGWLSQILMACIADIIVSSRNNAAVNKYNWLLRINLVSAYGMLASFPLQGYGIVSIAFSTLSIVNAYVFAVTAWRDLTITATKSLSHLWFKAALLFNVISSLGVFSLGYLTSHKINGQDLYLAAVYFFLHFQYNGWFFFAAAGLLMDWLEKEQLLHYNRQGKMIFILFFVAVFPTYLLSALWLPVPQCLYAFIVVGALAQLWASILLVRSLGRINIALSLSINPYVKWLWYLSTLALLIKLILQAASAIPALNTFSYGFRPVVIAYLHLVLLAMLSFFLIGYYITTNNYMFTQSLKYGLLFFIGGVVLNELLLLLQSIDAIMLQNTPAINYLLLGAALVMFTGLLIMNVAIQRKNYSCSRSFLGNDFTIKA